VPGWFDHTTQSDPTVIVNAVKTIAEYVDARYRKSASHIRMGVMPPVSCSKASLRRKIAAWRENLVPGY